jgi:hypothetical protein
VNDPTKKDTQEVRLPVRPFLYTLDQIATILNILEVSLIQSGHLFFSGRTPGMQSKDEMLAVNIALPREKPEWRVEERELIRWMKRKGFKFVG